MSGATLNMIDRALAEALTKAIPALRDLLHVEFPTVEDRTLRDCVVAVFSDVMFGRKSADTPAVLLGHIRARIKSTMS